MDPTAPRVKAQPELEPSLELRKEVTRIRAIMYDNTCLRLSTAAMDGGRWLTDQYVLLDVTDSPAIEGLYDGQYKLQAGKGLVPIYNEYPETGGKVLRSSEFDPDAYFNRLADAKWAPATPSEWSVAEHPGKAMLFSVEGPYAHMGEAQQVSAALMGESTWATLRKNYPGATAEYAVGGVGFHIFRILFGGHGELEVVAYVAGIKIPTGQEGIAQTIAELTIGESTSNGEAA